MAASNLREAADNADVDAPKLSMFMSTKNGSVKASHVWMEL